VQGKDRVCEVSQVGTKNVYGEKNLWVFCVSVFCLELIHGKTSTVVVLCITRAATWRMKTVLAFFSSLSCNDMKKHPFLPRDAMLSAVYATAIPSVRPSVCLLSVCLSVCPSHGWISQKRLKARSCNFHRTVAPSL